MKVPNEDEPLLDSIEDIPREAFGAPAAPEEIRNRVWRATSGYLYRRRLVRGAVRCSAAAALFVCGIGIGLSMTQNDGPPAAPIDHQALDTSAAANAELVPDVLLRDGEAFALRLEAASKSERLALLRRAGDRYLSELGDVRLALRCYQRMLDLEDSSTALTLDTNDSWLLMAIKSDRQRETQHDRSRA